MSGNPSNANEKAKEAANIKVASRLQKGGRILSLIHKAEMKRVAKRKIIQFLKKKGVSEDRIIEAYKDYYEEKGLYEITFESRPLGFSVIMDTRGKNAIVSSVQSKKNEELGMKLASRMYEINGKRVDGLKHREILKIIGASKCPFYVVFKETQRNGKKLKKLEKAKREDEMTWVEAPANGGDEDESSSESDSSDDSSSYSSDDDAAHVHKHLESKRRRKKERRRRKAKQGQGAGVFKFNELDAWDEDELDTERNEMFKQLATLMMGAALGADGQAAESLSVDGMTDSRKKTLSKLISTTPSARSLPPGGVGAMMGAATARDASVSSSDRNSVSSLSFGVSELMAEEDEQQYDTEIFRYLQDLTGDFDPHQMRAHTPSMSTVGRMWVADEEEESEVALHLPPGAFGGASGASGASGGGGTITPVGMSPQSNFDAALAGSAAGGGASPPSMEDAKESGGTGNEQVGDDEKVPGDGSVLATMKKGATLMKYGRFGRANYRLFQLTKDHRYLIWYSQRKDAAATRIPVAEIIKIAIGKESQVVTRTKDAEIHATSFTVEYGSKEKPSKLTVTAKNQKEAYVWAQGLKILADSAKRGQDVSSLKSLAMPKEDLRQRMHKRTQSVIISMDHVKSQSVLNLFGKSDDKSTAKMLSKRHTQLKGNLQKCVDFVMTKKNYKVIRSKGEFENIKGALENIDTRLRAVKKALMAGSGPNSASERSAIAGDAGEDGADKLDLSSCKADLFSIAADLDGLKQKLTVIVRVQKKL